MVHWIKKLLCFYGTRKFVDKEVQAYNYKKMDWINTIGTSIQYTYSEFGKPILGDSSKDNMNE